MTTNRFSLGQTVMTPGVQNLVLAGVVNPVALLDRHASGDWGDMDAEDKQTNDNGLQHGGRLMSVYTLGESFSLLEGTLGKVWVITEWDRSVTTLLLPDEY